MALREQDAETLDRTAGAIRGRSARVHNVVYAETDLYEADEVTNKVLETVSILRDQYHRFIYNQYYSNRKKIHL